MLLLLLCQIYDIISTSRENALAPNSTTHYHAQLGPPDKGHAIKVMVVCYVVWLGSLIYESLDKRKAVVWYLVVVRISIELQYHNTP